jgi:hypothetical protein
MDGRTTTKKCVLMEDGNDWAMLSLNTCPNGADRNISDLVVINPLYTYTAMGFANQPNVSASNTAITTMIYDR